MLGSYAGAWWRRDCRNCLEFNSKDTEVTYVYLPLTTTGSCTIHVVCKQRCECSFRILPLYENQASRSMHFKDSFVGMKSALRTQMFGVPWSLELARQSLMSVLPGGACVLPMVNRKKTSKRKPRKQSPKEKKSLEEAVKHSMHYHVDRNRTVVKFKVIKFWKLTM